jgi:WD domain, G-beta repeat
MNSKNRRICLYAPFGMFTIHQKNQAIFRAPFGSLTGCFDKELPMTDGYSQLLGIGTQARPLTFYQLLGIDPSEKDSATIRAAANACLGKLQAHASGALADDCAKITAEIIGARDTLLDPAARQRYDAEHAAPAPEPWWKSEVPNAVPGANPAPVADWWKDLQPTELAQPSAAPVIQAALSAHQPSNDPPTSVAAPIPISTPSKATAAWWSDAAKPAPAAAAPATADWWKDAATKEAVPIPRSAAASPAPVGVSVPIATAAPTKPSLAESLPLPAAPTQVQPLPLPPRPAAAPAALLEMSVDDEEFRPPDRRGSGSSMLPWILLGLIILAGSIGGGVWYVNQQNQAPPGRDVAVIDVKNKDSTPPVDPATKSKHTDPETAAPAKKSEPVRSKVDQPVVVDQVPEKTEEVKPPMKSVDFTKPRDFRSSMGTVLGIALCRDSSTFITTSSDKSVMAGATGTGDQTALHRLKSEGVAALCLDEKLAVFCDGFEIVVYDLQKKGAVKTFQNPRGGIQCLAASAKGGLVLTGSTDGCVRCWNLNTAKLEREIDVDEVAVTAVAVSSDGHSAAIGLADGGIRVCDLATGKLVKRWKGHAGRVTTLAFSPSGARLASGGEDSLGQVWDSATGKSIAKLAGHEGPILGSGFCADGRRIVTAGVDKKVCLWNAETGDLSNWACGTREKVFCIAIDFQDRFVLAGQSDGIVQLFPLPEK